VDSSVSKEGASSETMTRGTCSYGAKSSPATGCLPEIDLAPGKTRT